jgi:3-oxoacid CoA-transferase
LIITERAVFTVDNEKGLTLIEKAEDVTMEELVQSTGCIFRIAEDLKPMQQA